MRSTNPEKVDRRARPRRSESGARPLIEIGMTPNPAPTGALGFGVIEKWMKG